MLEPDIVVVHVRANVVQVLSVYRHPMGQTAKLFRKRRGEDLLPRRTVDAELELERHVIALEAHVVGLRGRERGEVVRADEGRRARVQGVAVERPRPPQRPGALERARRAQQPGTGGPSADCRGTREQGDRRGPQSVTAHRGDASGQPDAEARCAQGIEPGPDRHSRRARLALGLAPRASGVDG